jgi:hypothetical protein
MEPKQDHFAHASASQFLGPQRIDSANALIAMIETIHPRQLEGFRRMTPAQKLRMVADLYEAGIQLRMAGLRLAHPDWPPERLDRHARESLRHAGT